MDFNRINNRTWQSDCGGYQIQVTGNAPDYVYNAVDTGTGRIFARLSEHALTWRASAARDACEQHRILTAAWGK